jgi:hypothetical protein
VNDIEKSEDDSQWSKIAPEVEKAWSGIFQVVNKVIASHEHFGFELIESKINPSLTDILRSLKVLEAILDTLIAENGIGYDLYRMVVNAKQQITLIELVAVALKYKREDDYNEAIAKLCNQAQF